MPLVGEFATLSFLNQDFTAILLKINLYVLLQQINRKLKSLTLLINGWEMHG